MTDDNFDRNWTIIWTVFIVASIVFTVLLITVSNNQWQEKSERCEARGGVQIDQYHCVDKDAIR